MSTRFGTYVGHSAKSIVLETQLESSNFSFFKLYAFILLTSTLVPGINYFVVFFKLYAFILLTSTLVPGINYFVVTTHPLHQLGILELLIHRFVDLAATILIRVYW